MSNFFEGIQGTEDAAFGKNKIILIPDDTIVTAEIVHAIKTESKDGVIKYYEILWKVLDEEYKNRKLWQKLYCWDEKPQRAERAKNMLLLAMNLFGAKIPSTEPTDLDLDPIQGKIGKIKVKIWEIMRPDGTMSDGNWVSEIHAADFVSTESPKRQPIESAFSRNADKKYELDDCIPF